MASRTGLSDRPATIEQKAHVSGETEEENEDHPGNLLSLREAERARLRRQASDGQDRRQGEDGQRAKAMNFSIMARHGRRIALRLDRRSSGITARSRAGSPVTEARERARTVAAFLVNPSRSALQGKLEPILDRSVGRDPVHMSRRAVVGSPSRRRSKEFGDRLAVADLVPSHRALAVDFGGNREDPDDLMLVIQCVDLLSCPHQDGLFLRGMAAGHSAESAGTPSDSIGSGVSKTVVTVRAARSTSRRWFPDGT